MKSSDDSFKKKFNWSALNRKDCRKLKKRRYKGLACFVLAFILAFGPVGSALAYEQSDERNLLNSQGDIADTKTISEGSIKTENIPTEAVEKESDFASLKENTEDESVSDNFADLTINREDEINVNEWVAADFSYAEIPVLGTEDDDGYPDVYYGITGLSDSGKEKIESNKNLILPDKDSNGKIPLWVNENAFKGLGIEELTVPGNYTHIQDSAFENNAIKTLTLEEGVIYANSYAFLNNQIEELNLPSTFKYAAKGAFKNNNIKSIEFPQSCESIGPEAFMNNQITNIIFGDNTKHIFERAFKGNQITELNIPLSLKNIEDGIKGIYDSAFDDNPGLENPEIPSEKKVILWTKNKDNPNNLVNRGNFIVDPSAENLEYTIKDFTVKDGILTGFSAAGSKKLDKLGKGTVLKLPAKDSDSKAITQIGEYAFQNDVPEVDKIVVPQGYTKICDMAFWEASVKEIELPDSLESIGEMAFYRQDGETVTGYVSSQEKLKSINNQSDYVKLEVRGGVPSKPEKPKDSEKWLKGDFTYDSISVNIDNANTDLYAVTGLSDSGKEKYKTNKMIELPESDAAGKKIEAVANRAFTGSFGIRGITGVSIPEGYVYIGSMSFAFNSIEGELKLPSTLKSIEMGAFFRNRIDSVEIPENITYIPISCFRGNRLAKLVFKGDIVSIDRFAFGENRLEEINIPDSLKEIGIQAFEKNHGKAGYGGKLVLRTVSGNNPQKLPNKENYIIDPKEQENPDDMDYTKWTVEDFEYTGQTVNGFSADGFKKIKKNKALVIPDFNSEGKQVLKIEQDAFRALNSNFDIESVKIPDTVVEIGDYAFQFNELTEVTLPRDLETLGMGVFMSNSTLSDIKFNNKLKYIDQACFFECPIKELELPGSVEVVRNAAFRKCFLTSLKFNGNNLKKVDSLSFADNELSTVVLPEGLEEIGSQAFGKNKFTELNIPDSLKVIKIQAFVGNPGIKEYGNAVVLHTKDGKNINKLADDISGTFVIDPEIAADENDIAQLKDIIEKLETVDKESLGKDFKKYFEENLDYGKKVLENKKSSVAAVQGAVTALKFAQGRVELSMQMAKKEALEKKSSGFDKALWEDVDIAYTYAKRYLMIVNITDEKVKQLAGNLELALSRLESDGIYGSEYYDGEAEVPKTHYIEPYTIKVRVWVKDGKLAYVMDNKTQSDDPDEDEKHNEGYLEMAKPVLLRYIGKDISEIKASKNSKELDIDTISGATVSSMVYYDAIKNAVNKINGQSPDNPKPDNPKPDNPKPDKPDNSNPDKPGDVKPDSPKPDKNGNPAPEEPNKPIVPDNDKGKNQGNNGNKNNAGGSGSGRSGSGGNGGGGRLSNVKTSPDNSQESIIIDIVATIEAGEWIYNNGWYYKKDGKIVKSAWIKSNSRWFVVDKNGKLVENKWVRVKDSWFYAEDGGYISENKWIFNKNNWFYAENGGYISENKWIDLGGKWYFAKGGGYIALSSWENIGGKFYHFNADGSLSVNTQVDGHSIGADGARTD